MDGKAALWALCRSCAGEVYGRTAPNSRYAFATARLLFGTAAQESNLVWRRQRSCSWPGEVGGFSLWQVEYDASVMPSLAYLRRRADVLTRCNAWLWQDQHATDAWIDAGKAAHLWMLRGWDRFGVLMCRLHYMRVLSAIPETLPDQAAYWKQYYNTSAGKGTAEQYVANWRKHCAAAVEAAEI